MAKNKRKTTGKNAITLSLTSPAIDRLAEMAQKSGLSRSAFVENLMAGTVAITAPEAATNLLVSVSQSTDNKSQVQVSLADAPIANPPADTPVSNEGSAELEAKIAAQAKTIADLEEKLAAHSTALKRPADRSHSAENAASSSTNQNEKITSLEKQLKDQENQTKTLTNNLKTLQQNFDLIALEKAALQQDLDKKAQDLAQAQAAVAELNQQVTTKSQASQAHLEATITALQQEKERLLEQIRGANQAQASLQDAVTRLEEALRNNQADQAQALTQLQQAHQELRQKYVTQGDRLWALESKAHQTTGVTSVGEFYLNRWRKY
jgi:peptidoglycan DL-endopeptidase CwlO